MHGTPPDQPVETDLERLAVLGVPVVRARTDAVLRLLEARLGGEGEPATIFFANAHSLNLARRIPELELAMREATLVLNDGAGLALAGRMRRRPFPENLNGSDLSPRLLALAASVGAPTYFLGARPGVAERAAERMASAIDGLEIAGYRDGYFSSDETPRVLTDIHRSGAGLLLVAMGNPRQELWLSEHLGACGARVGVGVGAFFDFASGTLPRAPTWMNRAGIEWVWRFAHEPRRLAARYLIGNPLFIARAAREALGTALHS
jgi:exopolysaccharide biosynthesis WecB/TagA/CpsF family protein